MDSGEEIPLLNENWEFAGARLNEWMIGFVVMMLIMTIVGESGPGLMPIVFIAGLITAQSSAMLRRQFPDEERGVRNYFISVLGFNPPNIPPPSSLQPFWSGAPTRKLKQNCQYEKLGLHELFEDFMVDSDDII